ncbi:MAG TPA: hypothetical protein ENI69_03065 [Rhodospirillales bacterium]|nr:hypothetical protein [Rhodospirillales bacterium]
MIANAKTPAQRHPELASWMVIVLALAAAAAGFAGGFFIDLARVGAAMALIAQAVVEIFTGRKRFLTSPLFLLSTMGVLLYSVVQGLWGRQSPWQTKEFDFTGYVGSQAEATIVAFCMVALVSYVLMAHRSALPGGTGERAAAPWPLFLLPLVASALTALTFYLNVGQPQPVPFSGPLRAVAPALISLSLCLLIRSAGARQIGDKLAVLLVTLLALAGLVYVGEGKIVMFILLAISLYAVRLMEFSATRLVLIALAGALIMLATVQVLQQTRWKVRPGTGQADTTYSQIFLKKGVWRQTETGHCLGAVLKAHGDQPLQISRQLFWLKGLVPRLLWPEKPNLSLGQEYAVKYCAKAPQFLGQHSASITLLGQPVIMGGLIGLIIHGGLLILALAGIERLNRNPTALSTAFVAALLPWLIDFDQDFALYVANAVKFALVMAALLIPMALIERSAKTG